MQEAWKDIKGYEGLYQVSNLGRVKSLERKVWSGTTFYTRSEKLLKQWKCRSHNRDFYLYVTLSKHGIHKNVGVHRLVAQAFISNPSNLPEVNHKDGNKTNNVISNLEFCTCKENQNHSWSVLRRKSNKTKAEILDKLISLYRKNKNDDIKDILKDLSNEYGIDIIVYEWNDGKDNRD